MATKERLHKLIDELPDTPETERRLKAAERDLAPVDEDEMAPLPEGWGETLTGEPMPNVVAAVRRSREGH